MRRLSKLRKRLTRNERRRRNIRIVARKLEENDRDIEKWAAERRIPEQFRVAHKAGKRTGGRAASDAERLAAIDLTGA